MCLNTIDKKRVVSKAGTGYRLFYRGPGKNFRSLFWNSQSYELGQWYDAKDSISPVIGKGLRIWLSGQLLTTIHPYFSANKAGCHKRYIPFYHIFTSLKDATDYRTAIVCEDCCVVAKVSYKSVRYTGQQILSSGRLSSARNVNVVVAQKMRIDEVLAG